MQDVVRFWLEQGADGFRHRRRRPSRRSTPTCSTTRRARSRSRSRSRPTSPRSTAATRATGRPGSPRRSRALREAAGDAFLVGEVYRPTDELGPYLDHLDCAFVFELLFSPVAGRRGRRRDRARRRSGPAVLDALQPRLQPGREPRSARATCASRRCSCSRSPGTAFLYQGDEIGLLDGPGRRSARGPRGPRPRAAPDAVERRSAAGFTSGAAWLPPVDPAARNVADQRRDPVSLLQLYRALIGLRPNAGRRPGDGRGGPRWPARLPPGRRDRRAQPRPRRAAARPARRGAARDGPRSRRPRLGPGTGVVTRGSG